MSLPKVLLVDDEKNILSAFQRVLRKQGFELTVSSSPYEALEILSRDSYAVVVSDQRMPDMEGSRLLEEARKISPDTVRIILTGYADIKAAVKAINEGAVYRFLTKPWDDEDLRREIRQAVSQFELVSENKRLQALTAKQNTELKELNQNLEKKVQERTQEISRLNEELKNSFLGSVNVLAELSEMHSSVIGNHSKRVGALCKEIAERMELTENDIFQLEIAAILHDIGKIGVSSDILRKPEASLKHREVEILRSHAVKGEAIIRMVPHLEEASRLIRHHHEHIDGTGHPDQLRKDDIPAGSRIISVADAYDKALNTRASFESATPEKAVCSVQKQCPKWFDQDIVVLLRQCIQKGDKSRQEGVELEIPTRELREGMVISRSLRTARGILLLPADSVVRKKHLGQIQNYQETDPIIEGIYVYRRAPDASE